MFCKNCGLELTGTESVCPQCGMQVTNEQPVMVNPEMSSMEGSNQATAVNTQPVIETTTPVAGIAQEPQPVVTPEQPTIGSQPSLPPTAPVMEQQAPMMQNQPSIQQPTMGPIPAVQPVQQPGVAPQNQQPGQPQPGKKISTTTILLIAILAVVIIIGIILIVVLGKDKEASNTTTTNDTNTTPDTVGTVTKNTIAFDGYTFTIPDGYEATEDAKYGLVIENSMTAFIMKLDHYYNYDSYKEMLLKKYPEIGSDIEVELQGRKYLLVAYKADDNTYEGTSYVTELSKTECAVGGVTKADGSLPPESDFAILSKIINSATENGDSSFAAKDSDKKEMLELPKPSPKDVNFNNQ